MVRLHNVGITFPEKPKDKRSLTIAICDTLQEEVLASSKNTSVQEWGATAEPALGLSTVLSRHLV